jgi:hypothetical protein
MTQTSNEHLADRLFYRVNNPSAWPHGFDEEASELFREAAAALRASSGVEVKRLEWGKTSYGRPEVDTIVGVYRVFEHMSGGWAATFKTFNLVDPHGRKNFATEAEAVAAVEADYRQRILSCLSSPLPTVEVTEEMVERAARAMCERDRSDWNAASCLQTANGDEPEEQREYWRDKARAALSSVFSQNKGE